MPSAYTYTKYQLRLLVSAIRKATRERRHLGTSMISRLHKKVVEEGRDLRNEFIKVCGSGDIGQYSRN